MQKAFDLIDTHTHNLPHKVALQTRDGGGWINLTYRDIYQRSQQNAQKLISSGLSAGDRVILAAENCPEAPVALISIWRAGCTAVVLDPSLPREEADELVERSDARGIVLTEQVFSSQTIGTAYDLPMFSASENFSVFRDAPAKVPFHLGPTIDPDPELALLIFTSGTTGIPRGVMLTHGNLISSCCNMINALGIRIADKYLAILPSFHIAPLQGILLTLSSGVTVATISQITAETIRETAKEFQPTMTLMVPSLLERFVAAIEAELRKTSKLKQTMAEWVIAATHPFSETTASAIRRRFFRQIHANFGGSMKLIGTGGAKLEAGVQAKMQSFGFYVFQAYGLSETTGGITVDRLNQSKPGSAGLPVSDTQIRIAGRSGEPSGEILIKSPCVMKGYFRDPESSEKAIRNGWYHTGDLGYLDQDGHLFVTGRLKEIIVTADGKKSMPLEIEKLYGDLPEIEEIAVFGVKEKGGVSDCIHAAIVPQAGLTAHDRDTLLDKLRKIAARHPSHKRVVSFHLLDRLPKTTSMKVKRKELGRMFAETGARPEIGIPPEPSSQPDDRIVKAAEEKIISVIKEGWGLDETLIDAGASFIDYGVDSLKAKEAALLLEKAFERELSPTLFWEYPNITALAAYLSGKKKRATGASKAEHPVIEEPIAIVGMSCRLPGKVLSVEDYWRLLLQANSGIVEVPKDRWDIDRYYDPDPLAPGKMCTRHGGFLEDIDLFDASFFRISAKEARSMDPQQRILLEEVYFALENAAIPLADLRGQYVGQYVGISNIDYGQKIASRTSKDEIDLYQSSGNAISVAAGRIAYFLGTRGPTVSIDTACSSSLVAVHDACQAIRLGDCEMAIAAGINLILNPDITISFSKGGMMAPDGQCKTFDDEADGYVRGEGCGVVVLKPLSAALKDGNRIWATIRSWSMNQDGERNGLTAPNVEAKEELMARALARADLQPNEVPLIETHGTGTRLGDPIEVQAIANTYGQNRLSAQPLYLGAVKTNIGHLESAAGIAGLIKAVLSVQRGKIPANRNLNQVNRLIDLAAFHGRLPSESVEWGAAVGPRRAAVSSFGFSGTNAHLIVEQVREPSGSRKSSVERTAHIVTLSAKSQRSLEGQISAYGQLAHDADFSLPDLAYQANTGRDHFTFRSFVVASDPNDFRCRIEGPLPMRECQADSHKPTAFIFTGQGSQYVGMANELYRSHPEFKRHIDHCAALIGNRLPISLTELMFNQSAAQRLNDTRYTQPALFALEYSLAKLWMSWGIKPDYVMGHSVGEYAAAVIAGIMNLEDGFLIIERARLMADLPQGGGMLAAFTVEKELMAVIDSLGLAGQVDLAALNSPDQVVCSGPLNHLETLRRQLQKEGVKCKALTVSHAFHSHLMEPMLDEFRGFAEKIAYHPGDIPFVSNRDGAVLERMDADYWVKQVRSPVRFAEGLLTLQKLGAKRYVEIGPRPILAGFAMATLEPGAAVASSLQEGKGDWPYLLSQVGTLYLDGAPVNWRSFERPYDSARRWISLPSYSFERQRYWIEEATGISGDVGFLAAPHPLLHSMQPLAEEGGHLFDARISWDQPLWCKDHTVFNRVVFPGTGLLELMLAAARQIDETAIIENFAIQKPLIIDDKDGILIQLKLGPPDASGGRDLRLYATREKRMDTDFVLIADAEARSSDFPAKQVLQVAGDEVPVPEDLYDRLARQGLNYGETFSILKELHQGTENRYAYVELPKQALGPSYFLHPALLDASLHSLFSLLPEVPAGQVFIPFAIDRYQLWGLTEQSLWVKFSQIHQGTSGMSLRVDLFDNSKASIGIIEGLHLQKVDQYTLQAQGLQQGRFEFVVDYIQDHLELEDQTLSFDLFLQHEDSQLPNLLSKARIGYNLLSEDVPRWRGKRPLLCLWNTQSPKSDVAAEAEALAWKAIQILQRWSELDSDQPMIWLVHHLASLSLRGLARSARSENPDLDLRLIDAELTHLEPATLMEALHLKEPEIQVNAGKFFFPRLKRNPPQELLAPLGMTWRLDTLQPGSFDQLGFVEQEAVGLGPQDLRVGMRGGGLNLRDVLKALDLYPGDAGQMGFEFAGEILEIGSRVKDFRQGDRVMGIGQGCFAKEFVAKASLSCPIPDNLSDEEAATIPLCFLTAYYALNDLAGLKAGERILIHAAAGGVGMAAVQVARHLGAEVFATASPAKWDMVKANGVKAENIANSRNLGFAEAFKDAGIQVVLNSLIEEFIDKSLGLLEERGRFIEMGKRDLRDPQKIAQQHRGVIYRSFDLTECGEQRIGEIWRILAPLFANRRLKPLHRHVYPISQARAAFRLMAAAGHIGKVVLVREKALIPPDSTVIISGGLGAIGRSVARWLSAKHRVANLILLSRSDERAENVDGLFAELEASGTQVRVVACDVADQAALKMIMDTIPANLPLRGVMHCAGVLDDAMIAEQNRNKLRRVFRAKVAGSWALHDATLKHKLDFFVLFSSAAGTMGSPGQSNYAAANAFMDALALERRKLGLRATSIVWGPWDEGGMAARLSRQDKERLSRQGFIPLKSEEGMAILESAIHSGRAVTMGLNLDLQRLQRTFERLTVPPLLSRLVKAKPMQTTLPSSRKLRDQLQAAAEPDRFDLLLSTVRDELARVLGIRSSSEIQAGQAIQEMGLDSLMAAELRNRLSAFVGKKLPVTIGFDYPTLQEMTDYLLTLLDLPATGEESVPSAPTPVTSKGGSPWIQELKNPEPEMTVICFPHVGSDPAAYSHWLELMPASYAFHFVNLPGHMGRGAEPLMDDISGIVEALADAFVSRPIQGPFVFFGHSLGAILAFELCRTLRARSQPVPKALLVSALDAPKSFARSVAGGSGLGNLEEQVRKAITERLSDFEELATTYRKIMDADFKAIKSYRYQAQEKLDCPIFAIGGDDDPVYSKEGLACWGEETAAEFSVESIPGDHGYIFTEPGRLVSFISQKVESLS